MPALFGLGLKKNVIFDMLTNNITCKINPNDMFQWYYLDDLYNDIIFTILYNIRCINLFSEPVSMRELLFINPEFPLQEDSKTIIYDFHNYYQTKETIIEKIKDFVSLYNTLKNMKNKLVVSNLCWRLEEPKTLLNRYGIKHVELALTKYFSWDVLSTLNTLDLVNLKSIKERFKEYEVYSLQSLFFGLTHNIFIDTEEFINHFKHINSICGILNVKRLVFGSPVNRKLPDLMSYETGRALFIKTFQEISEFLNDDLIICIEHNATAYGCNFLTTIDETVAIIKDINRPNILMNLDTGNAMMMNESIDFESIREYVGHIQVSAPNLGSIMNNPKVNFDGYDGKISLEMKPAESFEEELVAFIKLFL